MYGDEIPGPCRVVSDAVLARFELCDPGSLQVCGSEAVPDAAEEVHGDHEDDLQLTDPKHEDEPLRRTLHLLKDRI